MSRELERSTLKRRAGASALGAAVAATALLTSAASAASAAAGSIGPAGAASHKLVLSAYQDAAEGTQLLAGHDEAVIEAIGPHGVRFAGDDVAASTNLCVAYIMTMRWDAARPACDAAVELAEGDVPEPDLISRELHLEQVAIAASNRAVLDWLQDHRASAADDPSRAKALAPASLVSQSPAHRSPAE